MRKSISTKISKKKSGTMNLLEQGPFLGTGRGLAASVSSQHPCPWVEGVAALKPQPHAQSDLSDTP